MIFNFIKKMTHYKVEVPLYSWRLEKGYVANVMTIPSLYAVASFMSLSWDRSVSIATGYGLDGQSLIPGRSKRFFSLQSIHTGSGAHSASHPKSTGG
jgi:hypothetical protein